MEPGKLISRALGEDFDTTVVVIADPSGDGENVRLALNKPAEANALDATANEEAASLDRLFGGSHHLQLSS